MKRTEAQELLAVHLKELYPRERIEFEYRFLDSRKWRFDVAMPDKRIGFECDGSNRHGSHSRHWEDGKANEKKNTAQAMGWKVLTFTNQYVLRGKAKEFLSKWL